MKINQIKVCKRFRKDLGDLEELKKSIKEIGLLQPIVVDENNNLIAGQRRLQAFKELSITDIDVNIIKIDSSLKGEYDENVIRKQFTPTEGVKIWEAMKSYQGKNQYTQEDVSNLDTSKKRDRAAKATKIGRTNLSKAKQVIEYGDKDIIKEMDKTENISGAYSKIKTAKTLADIEQQKKDIASGKIKLPEGVFENIVVDPPWDYKSEYNAETRRSANKYPPMTLEEIENIKLPLADDCILWFWTTQAFIFEAKRILDNWGFDYKGMLIWDKGQMGQGYWLRMQCEFCD